MFRNNNNIVALDIGTSTIKILVVSKESKESKLEVLSQVIVPCSGVRRGVVVRPTKVAEEVKSAVEQAQLSSGQKINSVYSSINGSHLTVVFSRGVIAVSRADREISQEDIDRAVQSAQAISLPQNKEIIDAFPKEFIIDGERGIKEPLGMKGTRLETEVLLLCAFSPYLQNLIKAVCGAGLQIADIAACPVAASEAVLTLQQKELGVAVIDIGADTTSLAVFEEENLIHTAVFPFGGNHITNDIAIGLRCDVNLAEKIKKEFGSCLFRRDKKEKYKRDKIKISGSLSFSRRILVGIIEARVSEIFEQINKELKKISRQKLLPAGIVLVGGSAKLPGIVDLAKKELKLPCRIGKLEGFIGLEEDPCLAVVCGLVMAGIDSGRDLGGFGEGIIDKIKRFFRIFVP